MRLKHAGSWCERRDLNPHGCPPDPKSGASAIPPLSHSAGGAIIGKKKYKKIFSLFKTKNTPRSAPDPRWPAEHPQEGGEVRLVRVHRTSSDEASGPPTLDAEGAHGVHDDTATPSTKKHMNVPLLFVRGARGCGARWRGRPCRGKRR